MSAFQITSGPVLGQVDDYAPSTLSDLRHILQDIREDFAELSEVSNHISSAPFEFTHDVRREVQNVDKEGQERGNG